MSYLKVNIGRLLKNYLSYLTNIFANNGFTKDGLTTCSARIFVQHTISNTKLNLSSLETSPYHFHRRSSSPKSDSSIVVFGGGVRRTEGAHTCANR